MKIITYLFKAKMTIRLFLVWIYLIIVASFSIGILYQVYRATAAFADAVPSIALMLAK